MIRYSIEKVPTETSREKRLQFLTEYFLDILAESPDVSGFNPNFNLAVLEAISSLRDNLANLPLREVIDLSQE